MLYTRSVMESTASELCRILTTKDSATSEERIRKFALRRLAAVPDGPPFHGGGEEDWEVSTKVADDAKSVSVTISGHAELFPLYGTIARLFSAGDEKGLKLSVTVTESVRPGWLSKGYSDWVGMWKS